MCKKAADVETGGPAEGKTPVRELLPTNVRPTHYDVTLEPDFETLKFDGRVVIDLDVVEESSSVAVNTLDLELGEITLTGTSADGSETVLTGPEVVFDEGKQTTTMTFSSSLPAGTKAKLDIQYVGELNDKMAGFYRSYYKKPDGTQGILATTQMEATDARRALPCFDEPALKAEFTVTLVAEKHLTCLSNMDVAGEEEVTSKGVAKKSVKFNKSPLMSTYLLAFIVGELNYIETNTFRVPVRVYAPPSEDIETGRFALELCAKGLAFYEETFGIPYPLPKMDQVAIPDFAAGAMENWGLITYRVVEVMFDEKTSGAATKERVATVVLHELAHQWFGNLVTMDWWEGLWLNEGWAEWGARYSTNHFFPEWKLKESFASEDLQAALGLDGLRSSHPIEVPVGRADEINQIFDSISYSKGSCIIHMISAYLGEEVFLEGVRRYLERHKYGNTATKDLWFALSQTSGKDVGTVMDVWTKNVGYPVVSIVEDEQTGGLHLEQHRFLTTGDVTSQDDTVTYPVFLNIRTKSGVDDSVILNQRSQYFLLSDRAAAAQAAPTEDHDDFYQVNAGYTGFYRTKYPPARLQKLGAAADRLLVQDRVGIVADASALATSGYQKTSDVLGLFRALSDGGESEFLVWSQILTRLNSIRTAWIEETDVAEALGNLQKDLSSPIAHKLGWEFGENVGHVEQQFKAMMFGAAGMAGDEAVVAAAKEMFKEFMAGNTSAVHPNIRASVFSINLKYGGIQEYDAVLNFMETTTNADQRNSALRCLGQARDPALRQRTIDLLLSGKVRDQDIYLPIGGLRATKDGIAALWQWLTTEWDAIYAKFPATSTMIGSIVGSCTGGFTQQKQLDEVLAFFEGKDKAGYDRSLAQNVDSIKAKIAWVKRDDSDVKKWLGM